MVRVGKTFFSSYQPPEKKTFAYPRQTDTFKHDSKTSFIDVSKRDDMMVAKSEREQALKDTIAKANEERHRDEYLGISSGMPSSLHQVEDYEDNGTRIQLAKKLLSHIMNREQVELATQWLIDSDLLQAFRKFGEIFIKNSPKGITASEFKALWNKVDTKIESPISNVKATEYNERQYRELLNQKNLDPFRDISGAIAAQIAKANKQLEIQLRRQGQMGAEDVLSRQSQINPTKIETKSAKANKQDFKLIKQHIYENQLETRLRNQGQMGAEDALSRQSQINPTSLNLQRTRSQESEYTIPMLPSDIGSNLTSKEIIEHNVLNEFKNTLSSAHGSSGNSSSGDSFLSDQDLTVRKPAGRPKGSKNKPPKHVWV